MSRNAYCPYYGDCLDRAVKRGAAGFDCSGCAHEHERLDETFQGFWGCCLLLVRLFLPGVYLEFVKSPDIFPEGSDMLIDDYGFSKIVRALLKDSDKL